MPRVSRKRTVGAPVAEVWKLVSDPYNLPRWWPRTARVENVEDRGGRRSRWTQVLETAEGRGVRADYRCVSAAENDPAPFSTATVAVPVRESASASRAR